MHLWLRSYHRVWVDRSQSGLHIWTHLAVLLHSSLLCQVAWGSGVNSPFQVQPQTLYWTEVQALTWPLQNIHPVVLKPFLCFSFSFSCSMLRVCFFVSKANWCWAWLIYKGNNRLKYTRIDVCLFMHLYVYMYQFKGHSVISVLKKLLKRLNVYFLPPYPHKDVLLFIFFYIPLHFPPAQQRSGTTGAGSVHQRAGVRTGGAESGHWCCRRLSASSRGTTWNLFVSVFTELLSRFIGLGHCQSPPMMRWQNIQKKGGGGEWGLCSKPFFRPMLHTSRCDFNVAVIFERTKSMGVSSFLFPS